VYGNTAGEAVTSISDTIYEASCNLLSSTETPLKYVSRLLIGSVLIQNVGIPICYKMEGKYKVVYYHP
jgi:hypothetical protein